MVQVSGTFGSRQEEAQRLGRILRPKGGEKPASFYTLVTRDTREMDFAHHRQLFLTEQGYSYEILDESDLDAHVVSVHRVRRFRERGWAGVAKCLSRFECVVLPRPDR